MNNEKYEAKGRREENRRFLWYNHVALFTKSRKEFREGDSESLLAMSSGRVLRFQFSPLMRSEPLPLFDSEKKYEPQRVLKRSHLSGRTRRLNIRTNAGRLHSSVRTYNKTKSRHLRILTLPCEPTCLIMKGHRPRNSS